MLTPENLAELRRLHSEWQETVNPYGFRLMPSGEYYALVAAVVNALPALLDAAAERDALAAKVEAATGALIDAGYRAAEDRSEADALRAMLAGRCLSDITHRDEEHRQSVCMLPVGHAPLAHDDCMGCTWTDADHWEPSAIDALAEECDGWRHLADVRAAAVERVRALHRRRAHSLGDFVAHGQTEFPDVCDHCRQVWPCTTISALDEREIA